jgi:hypothetical protein
MEVGMRKYDLDAVAAPEQLVSHARQNLRAHQGHEDPGGHPTMSVREVEYKGHRIVIETVYHITVDGEPVTGHVQVGNDGRVHYHAIPNQEFESAVDMVKRVIDLIPPDAPSTPSAPPTTNHHDHHH